MAEEGELAAGEYRLEKTESGWSLRVLPPFASWTAFIPRTLRGWILLGLALLLSMCTLNMFTPHVRGPINPSPLAGYCLTLWLVVGVGLWWRYAPPPIIAEYRANSLMHVDVENGHFDNGEGMFDVSHLASLRQTEQGALPGRVRLVFTGAVLPDAVFIGWPGLPPALATAIQHEVLTLLGKPQSSAASNER